MIRTVVSLALVCSLVGCVASVEDVALEEMDDVGFTAAPIVNGELGGNSAVVFLQNTRGGYCTGSLIGERVVLTAKHCVQRPFDPGPVRPEEMAVGVGDNWRRLTTVLRVQSIITTPGMYTETARGGVDSSLVGLDVAVMILQSGAPGVTPLEISREDHRELNGQTITAIGFGNTPSGEFGVKYTTTGRVTSTTENLIYVGPVFCSGDSGGPAVNESGTVSGVVSFGAGSCGSGYGAYNAIFPYLDLIDSALTEAGMCLNNGDEVCDGADNDCNGEVDEICTAIGGACTENLECVGLMCADTPGGRLCTAPCDPLRPETGCGPGLYCARTGGCEGLCVPLDGEADQPLGAACTSDSECVSLFCTDPGDGNQRCLAPCEGDAAICLAGEACAANPGDCGGCVDEAILAAARGIGEGCSDDDQCRSGMCFDDNGRSYCTGSCAMDDDCPDSFHCRDGTCASGPRGDLGDPCVSEGDCLMNTFCATQSNRSWCTRLCVVEECPEGFACVEAGGTVVCAPEAGLIGDTCATDDECLTGLCIDRGVDSRVCTRNCSPETPCAAGFDCERIGDGTESVCVRPLPEVVEEGGCAVGVSRRPSRATVIGLALFALAFLTRRRWRNR